VDRTETAKQYTSGDRTTRQFVVMATRANRLTPTNEGVDYFQNLSMVIDGYGGVEHMLGVTTIHDDLIRLLARSGTTWTPTLLIAADRGPYHYLNRILADYDLRHDARYTRLTPLQFRRLRGNDKIEVRPHDLYDAPRIAADIARLVAAGGRVGLGSHGELLPGIGPHIELWALASGGMRPIDVLRAGTIMSAEAIGHGRDLGSIEPGKLADLQILDANPLDDIRNTRSIRFVMRGGFLYDADTLEEIWPERRPLPQQWWQSNGD